MYDVFKKWVQTKLNDIGKNLKERWIIKDGEISRKRELVWNLVKKDLISGFQKGYIERIFKIKYKYWKINVFGDLQEFKYEMAKIKSEVLRLISSVLLSFLTIYILLLVLYQNESFNISDKVTFKKAIIFFEVNETTGINKEEIMKVLADTFTALGAGCFGLLGIMMGAIAVATSVINKFLENKSIDIREFDYAIEEFKRASSLLVSNVIVSLLFFLFTFTKVAVTLNLDYVFFALLLFFILFFMALFYTKKVFTSCFEFLVVGTPMEKKWIEYKAEKISVSKMMHRKIKKK
ncbi:hypothetical protein [Peribacillus frigoritolerans]|uniref:hypothetical protein n=1 Tax=Peribacillus TaxID=2675229 RepID=UPI001F4FBDAA|nr:hypothetical protein [Peribacillus frigoritolerans]MCK2017959.1 hypothetical protein [Peribacillus frigoritolerans]